MAHLYAVISDIHANYEALKAVVRDARSLARKEGLPKPKFLCLGDVVDYGPHPNECMRWVLNNKPQITLLGNHDAEAIRDLFHKPERVGSEWWPITMWTRYMLKDQYKKLMSDWPSVLSAPGALEAFLVFHGDPLGQDRYLADPGAAQEAFRQIRQRNLHHGLFGHTHYQMLFYMDSKGKVRTMYAHPEGCGEPLDEDGERVHQHPEDWWLDNRRSGGRLLVNQWYEFPLYNTLINPGSVGQPRHHPEQCCYRDAPHDLRCDSRAAYLLIHVDSEIWRFQWRRVEYNKDIVVRQLCSLQWPEEACLKRSGYDVLKDHLSPEDTGTRAPLNIFSSEDIRKLRGEFPNLTARLAEILEGGGGTPC